MRFKKYASAKVIAILSATLILFGSMFYQHKTINELRSQNETQQTKIEQLTNHSKTFIDIKSIETKLNSQCEFKIKHGKVNIKHTYEYTREGFLGMEHKNKIVGTADLYYELTTDLRYAKVTYADCDQINVVVQLPEINDKACHRVVGTFRRMDDECSQSILSNRLDAQTALNHWEDTFDIKGIEQIKEYYTYGDARQNLINETEEQIDILFRELGYNQHVNVTVDDGARNTMNMGDDDIMKTQNGFTLMENTSEIGSYLKKQNVTRKISRIQIHHMAIPNYKIWESTDKKIFSEPHFGRTNSLDSYGKSTWGSKDVNGKYIAQHFNVFPDGQITSGRSLNSNPIGITGWNATAICIEIYGNFDKGQDTMNEEQKKAVIALVGELCKRFDIKPGIDTVRYHCWFDRKGNYLGNYVLGKSTKTCPGTNFFGGNTVADYQANFLPAIKNYISNNTQTSKPIAESYMVKINTNSLNIRKGPGTSYSVVGTVKKNEVYTIVETRGKWGKLKSGAGWIHLNYTIKK